MNELGGISRRNSVSVVGSFAELMLRNFNCGKLFIGVDGLDLEFGLTTNMLEATLNNAMLEAGRRSSSWPTDIVRRNAERDGWKKKADDKQGRPLFACRRFCLTV